MKRICIINGPNLNMLEHRDPSHYGCMSLSMINDTLKEIGERRGYFCDFLQSNHEGVIIDKIHEIALDETVAGLIINPGAFAHTSIAIRDALELMKRPVIEVHLSNIHAREAFRSHSHTASVVTGIISGFKEKSYELAMTAIMDAE